MKLLRYGPVGAEKPAILSDGIYYDLRPISGDIDGAFLAGDGIKVARSAIEGGFLPQVDISDERIGAPVARPQSVVCVGMNYAAHAAESGSEPPREPVIFLKTPNTVVGPFDDVLLPHNSSKVDWEVELAVIISKRASYVTSPETALDYVAGYSISNDVSEREWQLEISGGQWSKGKCAPTFNPLGPYFVPADEFDPGNARLWSTVNAQARQDSNTCDLIFDVKQLVWAVSQYLALEPGDILNTGTPEGVALSGRFPYLHDADFVELGIDGIGAQRQWVRSSP